MSVDAYMRGRETVRLQGLQYYTCECYEPNQIGYLLKLKKQKHGDFLFTLSCLKLAKQN